MTLECMAVEVRFQNINLAPNIAHIWKELTVAAHANSPCPWIKTTRSPRDIAISCKSIFYKIKSEFIVWSPIA